MSDPNIYLQDLHEWMSNKEKRSARIQNARIRGRHSKEDWEALKEYHNGACCICGSSSIGVEKDHIVPVYQGGCDCIHNIQPLCARCNASKGPESEDYRQCGWSDFVFGREVCNA